ncbi:MAG: hypothetical protein IT562_13115 [Alphaproteobacteria bacterium]|nr:hypothetical protein [Alphaproteobacteria bacterium]
MLYVVKSRDRWSVEAGADVLGTFASRHSATGRAIDAAVDAGLQGTPCRVIAQGENEADWETLWPPDWRR